MSDVFLSKMKSASPMSRRPAVTISIPSHICGWMDRPRKATDRRPVNIMTAPITTTTITIIIMIYVVSMSRNLAGGILQEVAVQLVVGLTNRCVWLWISDYCMNIDTNEHHLSLRSSVHNRLMIRWVSKVIRLGESSLEWPNQDCGIHCRTVCGMLPQWTFFILRLRNTNLDFGLLIILWPFVGLYR